MPKTGTCTVGVTFLVLIPAYNEEATIGEVVRVCRAAPSVSKVLVVSDGSTDHTSEEARKQGAQVIELPQNQGKDKAIQAGIEAEYTDYLVLVDADLIGLQPRHLEALIEPVRMQKADTTVGVFTKGRWMTDWAQSLTPFLNGQRVLSRTVWIEAISSVLGVGFGMETVLSRYIHRKGLNLVRVPLTGVTQRRKEEKLGFWRGFRYRLRMYRQILVVLWKRQ
jgi:glycosyltransferase involved in cell wall biosynthesis